jgi:hypothetical protein
VPQPATLPPASLQAWQDANAISILLQDQ